MDGASHKIGMVISIKSNRKFQERVISQMAKFRNIIVGYKFDLIESFKEGSYLKTTKFRNIIVGYKFSHI